MKKKKRTLPVCIAGVIVILLLGCITAAGISASAKNLTVTVGRCLVADNGSYLLIDGNCPIVLSDKSGDGSLFSALQTGDEILVAHDGINETYPAQTRAYYCKRLGGGNTDDIPQSVIAELTELGWLGESETRPENAAERAKTVSVSKNYANMSLEIPDGWEYEMTKDTEYHTFGISFWPAGNSDGRLTLRFETMFGVCGTGLSQQKINVGNYSAYMGTYDNRKVFDFIAFENTPGSYVVINDGAEEWWDEHGREAMSILSTVTLAEGIMGMDEAVQIARETLRDVPEYDKYYGRFDSETGIWQIEFCTENDRLNGQTFFVDSNGNCTRK